MKQAKLIRSAVAFGWDIRKMALSAGRSYGVLIYKDVPRKSIGTITLFTKGRIVGENLTTGSALDDRVPGVLSTTLGPLNAGRRVLTAKEDSEWWCIDSKLNGGELPSAFLVSAKGGEVVHGMCFVASGANEGLSFTDHTAKDDCMVLVFDRRRP